MYKEINWEIAIWGVRGSASAPFKEYMEYGGNTSCISVKRENHMIVFDAGTGFTALGNKWNQQKCVRLDIIISHLHMDHVVGLFLFEPLLSANVKINLYGRAGLEESLKQMLSPPWWPIGIQHFKAEICFHEIQPGARFSLGNFKVSTMEGNHPGGSILYRLDGDGKRLLYASDYEFEEEKAARFSDFAHGSDLIIWDANFTADDFKKGWGHSTWEQGIRTGHDAAAKHVLMTHYGHRYTDSFLREQEKKACKDALCIFAKEGMEIIL